MGEIIDFGCSDNLIASDVIFYDVKDVARELKFSIPKAREIMHRADFPLISIDICRCFFCIETTRARSMRIV